MNAILKYIAHAASVVLPCAPLLLSSCVSADPPPDVILVGGPIWTGEGAPSTGPTAPTGLAVREGRVQAVGPAADIEALAGPDTRRIDLAGRRVLPGFMDSHTHFIGGGFELASVYLRDADSPAEFTRRIAEYAGEHPGEWMLGGQWDHTLWGSELPRRDWIDSVTAATPVFVSRLDGHMGLANTAALEAAGINADTPDPPGGTIVRYPDGRPTGVLKDAAQSLVGAAIPAQSDAELDRALGAATAHAVSLGVTHVVDVGGTATWRSLEAYRRALARDALPIRVYAVVPLSDWRRLADYVSAEGRGDDRLGWGGLKEFVDGSLGSSTAWFYEPFVGEPGNTGLIVTDTAALRRWITGADSAGLQVMVHAIGTAANDWLLDAFAFARAANGPRDRRFRIEHVQHLRDETIRRIAADDVIASMQPYHAIDDGRWAEERIGHERALGTYAFRGLLDAGARLAFGSDWTVAPLDPLEGVYAALTRRTIDGANPDGWIPEQKITLEEALAAYSTGAAWSSFRDADLGRLDPGYLADLVVLSGDIFDTAPEAIPELRVEVTMVGGQVVWEGSTDRPAADVRHIP
jgi:predicted amidohydrolase YtcJ